MEGIDLRFSFERSAVPLASGGFFLPLQDAAERWIAKQQSMYEIIGWHVRGLYRLHEDSYVLAEFISDEEPVNVRTDGSRPIYRITSVNAYRISPQQALTFLINGQFEIPDSLRPLLTALNQPPSAPEARRPPPPDPPRTPASWIGAVRLGNQVRSEASGVRVMPLLDGIVDLGIPMVQELRTWPDWRIARRYEKIHAVTDALWVRFPLDHKKWWGSKNVIPPAELGLLELKWPDGSEAIRQAVVELQSLLEGPAVVLAIPDEPMFLSPQPTREERRLAEDRLIEVTGQLEERILIVRDGLQQLRSGELLEELRKRPRLKIPPDEAFQTYLLYKQFSATQKGVATALVSLKGETIDQGTVSRRVSMVQDWMDAGNEFPGSIVLPPASDARRPKVDVMDPADIEKGAPQDGRTPRQRKKRTDS